MIVQCDKCKKFFNDEFRITICPHQAFPANDGKNNFHYHTDSYLSSKPPIKGLECISKSKRKKKRVRCT